MKNARTVHQLAEMNKPYGKSTFIHSDGKEHIYASCVNELTGDRMNWFDGNAPTIGMTVPETRKVFKNIRANAQVLETIGEF